MDESLNLTGITVFLSSLKIENHVFEVYPGERHVRQGQPGPNEELARDNQYILQTLIEIDERLQKLEVSRNQGNGTANSL